MLDIFSRHRPLALLTAVLLAQLMLLAFQIKREHDVRLIRYWAIAVTSPVERTATWTFAKLDGGWTGYIWLHNARSENARLQSEVNQLRLQNSELESQVLEAKRVGLLQSFREVHPEAPMIFAQVIGASADPSSHTLFIDRGERDHLRRNLAVITADGIAGKIVEVFPNTAQVLLINDKDSGVGALLSDTRTHGIVKGSGDPEPHLDYVVNDEKVHPGEVILTSGDDRIFPKGLLVGTVTDSSPSNPFQSIHIQAAARLDRLEDVIVLLSQQELTPKPGEDAGVIPDTNTASDGEQAAQAAPANAPADANVNAAGGGSPKTASRAPNPAAKSAPSPTAGSAGRNQ
jgi:rod shape-determining protein MreC